jgi:predicted acetyltransferase
MLKDQLKNLWKDLFNDEWSYIDWYFENIYQENTTKTYLEDNYLKGMLFENKYHLSVGDERFLGRYLVGVGVAPERRGEGIMKNLLLKSLKKAKEFGEEFVYLTPIDKEIYEPFGFGYISKLSKYEVDFSALQEFKRKFKVEKIESTNYKEELLIKLKEFYRENSKEYFVKVAREKEDYKKILSEIFCEDGLVYISYDLFEKINGYIFLTKSKNICVKEFLFNDKDTLESLLSVLYGYKNYYEKLEFIFPENTYLEDYFKSEKNVKKIIKNKVQARILDVEKVLKRISGNLRENEEIIIHVQDNYFPENNGSFKLSFKNVERTLEEFHISLKIKELTILSYGFRDFNSLKKLESFYVKNKDKEEILSKIFQKKVNYFNQDF